MLIGEPQVRLEQVVAIRILSPGVLAGQEAPRNFRREALAKLNHPRIARCMPSASRTARRCRP
jgi:hypothetical protein